MRVQREIYSKLKIVSKIQIYTAEHRRLHEKGKEELKRNLVITLKTAYTKNS